MFKPWCEWDISYRPEQGGSQGVSKKDICLLIFTTISNFSVFPLPPPSRLISYMSKVFLYFQIAAVHSHVSLNVETRKMASLPSTFWRICRMNTKTNALKKFYLMLAVVSPFFVYTTLCNLLYTLFINPSVMWVGTSDESRRRA